MKYCHNIFKLMLELYIVIQGLSKRFERFKFGIFYILLSK